MANTKRSTLIKRAVKDKPQEETETLRKPVGDPLTVQEEIAEDKLEQMLLEAGLLSEIPPPITDFTSYRKRKPIKVRGKPVSETIIEERR
ncbi:MAG: hypothetical protein QOH25_1690 [Acidobacteriota bacterium]|jgi:hypothetical protein|nr:hypothetical protein [Acidobacteriota bacterium]